MLFVDFECPSCHQRRQTGPEVLAIMCRNCGALLKVDQSGTWATGVWIQLDENPEAIPRQRFVEKRLAVVQQSMEMARRAHEPGEWRMFAYEAKALELCMNPDLLDEKTNEAQLAWLDEEVIIGELMNFDRQLQDQMHHFKQAARRLRSGTDVMVVQEMLRRATLLYRKMLENPECPDSVRDTSPDEYGRNMVLATLDSFRRTLGDRTVDTLVRRALPEKPRTTAVTCPVCGYVTRDVDRDQLRILCRSCGSPVPV